MNRRATLSERRLCDNLLDLGRRRGRPCGWRRDDRLPRLRHAGWQPVVIGHGVAVARSWRQFMVGASKRTGVRGLR